MTTCAKCGTENLAGDAFCGGCGAFLEFAAEEAAEEAQAGEGAPADATDAERLSHRRRFPRLRAPSAAARRPGLGLARWDDARGRGSGAGGAVRSDLLRVRAPEPRRATLLHLVRRPPPGGVADRRPGPGVAAVVGRIRRGRPGSSPRPRSRPRRPRRPRPRPAHPSGGGSRLPLIGGALVVLALLGGGAVLVLGGGLGGGTPGPSASARPVGRRCLDEPRRGAERRADGTRRDARADRHAVDHAGADGRAGHHPARPLGRHRDHRRDGLEPAGGQPGSEVPLRRVAVDGLEERDGQAGRLVGRGLLRRHGGHEDPDLDRLAAGRRRLLRQPPAAERDRRLRWRRAPARRAQGRLRGRRACPSRPSWGSWGRRACASRSSTPIPRARPRPPEARRRKSRSARSASSASRPRREPGRGNRGAAARGARVIHQVRELHVRREARARHHLDDALFTLSGNAILPNLAAVRALAASMTAERRTAGTPDPVVAPGSLNAMGLIDEILHVVVAVYREQEDPEAVDDALDHLDEVLGTAAVDEVLLRFTTDFPPLAVHRGELTPEAYLAGETAGTPNREVALEELAACWLENANPAFAPYRELFDDGALAAATAYRAVVAELGRFFAGRAPFGPDQQDLRDDAAGAGPGRARVAGGAAPLDPGALGRLPGGLPRRAVRRPAGPSRDRPRRGGRGGARPLDAPPPGPGRRRRSGPRPLLRRPRPGAGALLRGPRLDAARRAHGQERVRLAGPAEPLVRPRDPPPGPGPRRGAGPARPVGVHRPLADRPLGAEPGEPGDQAARGGTRTRWRPPTPCATTPSPRTSAARPPGRSCATAPGRGASAWPPTWSPTTWGSTRAGSWSSRTGSSPGPTARTRPTASAASTSRTTRGSGSRSRTTTGIRPTPRSSSAARTAGPATSATSTTATTARACRGTTRPSWTT